MSLYLRLSVTDRCNFFCRYCRPRGANRPAGQERLTDGEVLALVEHIHRVAPLRKVRLTGGDPLLRPGLARLVAALRKQLPDAELCLTTNGARLDREATALRRAGLDRLNVSLDSLSPARFAAITGVDRLDRVLAGIDAARAAGFTGLKLNAVLLRSGSGAELGALVRFAASQEAELRLIELMPMGPARRIYDAEYLPAAEALARLRRELTYLGTAPGSDTSQRHRFDLDGREITVGVITPVSEPFCTRCDRIRLDSRGRLLSCLRRRRGVELISALREGRTDELDRRIAALLSGKDLPASNWPSRQMALIGG